MKRAVGGLIACALAVGAVGTITIRHVAANNFRPCHDNTTAPGHTWTHGDPIKGIPGDPLGGSGYYYLSIQACGPIVEGTVYSPGEWDMDISPDLNNHNELAAARFHGVGGRVFITNAQAGQNYRLRVANISTQVQKDYAELNSGAAGDGKGDCGGPGREIDPNTQGAPVDPAPTPGLPVMGCGQAAAVAPPPTSVAPRALAPPAPAPQSKPAVLIGRIPAPVAPAPPPPITDTGLPVALDPGIAPSHGAQPPVVGLAASGITDSARIAAASGLASIAVIVGLIAVRGRGAGWRLGTVRYRR